MPRKIESRLIRRLIMVLLALNPQDLNPMLRIELSELMLELKRLLEPNHANTLTDRER